MERDCRNKKFDSTNGGLLPFTTNTGYVGRRPPKAAYNGSPKPGNGTAITGNGSPKPATGPPKSGNGSKTGNTGGGNVATETTKRGEGQLLFVPFVSGEISVGALVDTGADLCTVSEELLSKLAVEEVEEINSSVKIASGRQVSVSKRVQVSFTMNNVKHTHWFTVLEKSLV